MSALSLSVGVAADPATATYGAGTLALKLRYEMVCGLPGRGPLVVELPSSFTVSRLSARVDGAPRPAAMRGDTITVQLPKPPQITCMSITEGTLRVSVAHVHAPPGTYAISAALPRFRFVAALRVTS